MEYLTIKALKFFENRKPRFEYSNINSSEIFLNSIFKFLATYSIKFRFLKVFILIHGVFLRIRLLTIQCLVVKKGHTYLNNFV